MTNKSETWLVKKHGAYYRAKAHGYTDELSHAGLFTFSDAAAHTNGNPGVSMVRLDHVLKEIDAKRLDLQRQLEALDEFERKALGLR